MELIANDLQAFGGEISFFTVEKTFLWALFPRNVTLENVENV